MLNDADSNMAANAICHAAEMTKESWRYMLSCYERPSVIFKPRIYPDGDKWCCLYGENLHDGVAGFGETPAKACEEFDKAWTENRRPK